jgi:hypothetical protein
MMGELQVDDEVFGADGYACRVVAATGAMVGHPCYEVLFSDGQSIVADASHLWLTMTKSARKHGGGAAVRTTAELATSLRAQLEYNHHVALADAVRYPEQPLPIDPYVLGSWLGDDAGDEQLRSLGLLDSKHVPELYLRSAVPQRLALLQGLMDSGGDVDPQGRCEFVSVRENLADAMLELAASLGLRPVKRKKKATFRGVDHGVAFQVKFTPHLNVFRLERKAARLKNSAVQRFRAIVDVRRVPTRPVRCIEVDSADGLFLAGPTFIPTHNSSLGRLGLLTHSTAGFIDPGFTGHITLELSNVANLPITLWPGMKIGQLCLFRLSSPAEHPYGSTGVGSRYQGQRGPTPSRAYLNFQRIDTRRGTISTER